MNKRGLWIISLVLSILLIATFVSADLQDTLQQKVDNIQDKADKAEQLANTLSYKESREEYLANKWAEFMNKTTIGKTIFSTTKTIKTADPLIELIFGAKFNFNLSFLFIFSIWLLIFALTRKKFMPAISSKIKVYSPLYHGIIAFIIASLFGGLKLINLVSSKIILIINKIPSLFTQIFILLVLSVILIYYSIKIKYPYYEEHQLYVNSKQNTIIANQQRQLKEEKEEIEKSKRNIKKVEENTGLAETKNLSPEERQLKKDRIKSGLEIAEKLGEALENSEEEIEKIIKRTELKKPEKLKKPKKLY
jgi:hypothetical protein